MPAETGLESLRVVDFSFGIAGAYCTQLLSDAGADVVKVEPPEGDPWRSWSAGDAAESTVDPVRARRCSASSTTASGRCVGRPGERGVDELVAGGRRRASTASRPTSSTRPAARARTRGSSCCSITPYGRTGPYAGRPNTEFIVQAESGGLDRPGSAPTRCRSGRRPHQRVAGGHVRRGRGRGRGPVRARLTGHGEHIDFSVMEVMTIAGGSYAELAYQLRREPAGHDACTGPSRRRRSSRRSTATSASAPTAAPSSTASCSSSSAPTSSATSSWPCSSERQQRWTEWNEARPRVDDAAHHRRDRAARERAADPGRAGARAARPSSTATTSSRATCSSTTRPARSRCRAGRGAWTTTDPPPPRPSPRLGEHTGTIEARPPARPAAPIGDRRLPLAGVRVLDLTAWWAGPIAAGMIAALGADVIHVESVGRIDGMRTTGAPDGSDGAWWERSAHYLCSNTNKRDLTLDLAHRDGLRAPAAARSRESDAVLENFSPRVLGELRPRVGADPGDQPALHPRAHARVRAVGPVARQRRVRADDGAGHAASRGSPGTPTTSPASSAARATRTRACTPRSRSWSGSPTATRPGLGCLLEVTMVEGALERRRRAGDRDDRVRQPARTRRQPQPARRAAGPVPRAGSTTSGWRSRSRPTSSGAGCVPRSASPSGRPIRRSTTYAGRRARHDELDDGSREWCARARRRTRRPSCSSRTACPPRRRRDPRLMFDNPQLQHRGFYEEIDHPVVGRKLLPGLPFRFASIDERLAADGSPARTAARRAQPRDPRRDLGVDDDDAGRARAPREVIGTRPR